MRYERKEAEQNAAHMFTNATIYSNKRNESERREPIDLPFGKVIHILTYGIPL